MRAIWGFLAMTVLLVGAGGFVGRSVASTSDPSLSYRAYVPAVARDEAAAATSTPTPETLDSIVADVCSRGRNVATSELDGLLQEGAGRAAALGVSAYDFGYAFGKNCTDVAQRWLAAHATATPTLTPTPIPTSAPAGLSVRNTTWYTSSTGTIHVVGEVLNNLPRAAQYVQVTARFYSGSGALLATDYTFTEVDILASGADSPFDLLLLSPNPPRVRLTRCVEDQNCRLAG